MKAYSCLARSSKKIHQYRDQDDIFLLTTVSYDGCNSMGSMGFTELF